MLSSLPLLHKEHQLREIAWLELAKQYAKTNLVLKKRVSFFTLPFCLGLKMRGDEDNYLGLGFGGSVVTEQNPQKGNIS